MKGRKQSLGMIVLHAWRVPLTEIFCLFVLFCFLLDHNIKFFWRPISHWHCKSDGKKYFKYMQRDLHTHRKRAFYGVYGDRVEYIYFPVGQIPPAGPYQVGVDGYDDSPPWTGLSLTVG
jgi:hypothetical protein